jgi:hypothetical protein
MTGNLAMLTIRSNFIDEAPIKLLRPRSFLDGIRESTKSPCPIVSCIVVEDLLV